MLISMETEKPRLGNCSRNSCAHGHTNYNGDRETEIGNCSRNSCTHGHADYNGDRETETHMVEGGGADVIKMAKQRKQTALQLVVPNL